jgi:hypothetical protein
MFLFDTKNQRTYTQITKKKDLVDQLQELVGGSFQMIPHKLGYKAPFVAYVNEEGFNLDLPSNWLAWGVLTNLGFYGSSVIPGAFLGNVVLLGKNEAKISAQAALKVKEAFQNYLDEMGEEPEEDEDEEKPPLKRKLEDEDDEESSSSKKKKIRRDKSD